MVIGEIMKNMNFKGIQIYKRKISAKDISILCKQFSVLLGAGINLSEVLNILSEQSKSKRLRKYLYNIYKEVQRGEELGTAMNRMDKVFPSFMLQMIKVGECSGKLEHIFRSLSEYYYNENKIKRKVIDALRYPIVLFIITFIIFLFLMTKIVPTFTETLTSLGAELPTITKVLLAVSEVIKNNVIFFILCPIITTITLCCYSKTSRGKIFTSKVKLNIPIIKGLHKKILTVKFSKYLAMLLSSGFNVINSLQTLSDIMGNAIVERKIRDSIDYIKVGESLTYSINKIEIFDPLLISMMAIGEESGKLEEMLTKSAEIYEEEVYEAIEKGTKLIEPTMIVGISFFVGSIILSIVIPMFSVMDNMGA